VLQYAPHQPTHDLSHVLNTTTLQEPTEAAWYTDTSATSHLTSVLGTLNNLFNLRSIKHIIVSDGFFIHVSSMGSTMLNASTHSLYLNNVLVAPKIIKSLIFIR